MMMKAAALLVIMTNLAYLGMYKYHHEKRDKHVVRYKYWEVQLYKEVK